MTGPDLITILLAYAVAAVIGFLGHRAHALTTSGALAAAAVGGTVFAFGGLGWAVLLVLFFVTSSGLSFLKGSDARKRRAAETFEKGGRRDAYQVLANGGIAALAALLLPLTGYTLYGLLFGVFVGSLAAATADTWATEVGTLSSKAPRLLTTGKTVPPGTSGGVTLLGSSASLLGAVIMGAAAAAVDLVAKSGAGWAALLVAGVAGGVGGSLIDSLLGATVQASYFCPVCQKPTESRIHRCGTPTRLVSGLPFINNDLVNGAATLAGGLAGALVWALLG